MQSTSDLLLSRRFLLSLFVLALPTLVAAAQQATSTNPEPGKGEILLEGKITGGSRRERKMTLLVERVVSPDGTGTTLDPPRPRDVQLSDATGLVNLGNAEQSLVPEGLMLGLRVSVIGNDGDTGTVLPARLILVDTGTPEQRTLLEQGQLAAATMTFTRLGDKSWWNFRCSEQAKATMSAYRGGLSMTVEKPAQSYDVQFQHGDIAVSEGDLVTVSFRAKSDRARTLHVEAQAMGNGYPDIGLNRDLALTPEWKSYTLTFPAKKVGTRNQIIFGVGQENGTVWLESLRFMVAGSGAAKPAAPKSVPVAKSGTTPFTGALVTQVDLFSLIGKRYDWTRGGEQPFTLLLSSEDEPVKLVPITLTARSGVSRLETENGGGMLVRTLDWKKAGDPDPVGYLMIGPDNELIKGESRSAFFPEPVYRMHGAATRTPTGWEMQMREPYRDRWRVEKLPDGGWKVSVSAARGTPVGFVETDAAFNPTRLRWPLNGDDTARVFSATIAASKITWDLPLLPALGKDVP